jgi:type IV pilus assembly protein PilW
MFKRNNQCRGMMLLELLISIALGLMIVASVSSIYAITNKNHQRQLALNSIEENARNAIFILKNDIQYAGYIGCIKLDKEGIVDWNNKLYLSPTNRVYGSNDSIRVMHVNKIGALSLKDPEDQSIIWVSSRPIFKKNTLAIISDCQHAEVISIESVSDFKTMQRLTVLSPLHQHYNAFAEVGRLTQNTFFVKATARKNTRGKRIFALYVENIHHHVMELVEGIDKMKLTYDVEYNSEIISLSARYVTDWSKVVGVLIQLTVTATEGLALQKEWYTYVALREI